MEAVFFSFASGVDNLVDCAEQKGVFDVLIQRILCGIAKNSIWEYNKLNGYSTYFLQKNNFNHQKKPLSGIKEKF